MFADYETRNLSENEEDAGTSLSFLEECFGEGQELLLFETGLTGR